MSDGNSGFTKIYNSNNQFSTLTVEDLNASNVDANVINGEKFYTITGYTPVNFSTGSQNEIFAIMNSPNQQPATSSKDSRLVRIPQGAIIYKIIVSNNNDNIVGGTKFDIGGFPITDILNPSIQFPIIQNATVDNINNGLYSIFLSAPNPPVNAGITFTTKVPSPFFGSVKILGNNNIKGQMKISLTYFLL
jgi:hypothetical protein